MRKLLRKEGIFMKSAINNSNNFKASSKMDRWSRAWNNLLQSRIKCQKQQSSARKGRHFDENLCKIQTTRHFQMGIE
jgi:hypothetical protein